MVNQKFTTVTALAANSLSLLTSLPSRSLPVKAGNLGPVLSAGAPPEVLASEGAPPEVMEPEGTSSEGTLAELSELSVLSLARLGNFSSSAAS